MKTLQYKTIPVTKLILSNYLNCLDIPHTYSLKTLRNYSDQLLQLLEEQLLTPAFRKCCCSTFCVNRVLKISNPKVFLIGFISLQYKASFDYTDLILKQDFSTLKKQQQQQQQQKQTNKQKSSTSKI